MRRLPEATVLNQAREDGIFNQCGNNENRSKQVYNHFEDRVIEVCGRVDVGKAWKEMNQ